MITAGDDNGERWWQMAERGAWRIAGRPVKAWAEPMRRVVSRILPGDDDPAAPAAPAGEWLVDCAVYADGVRLPGEPDFRTALRTAAREDGFVWLGVRDPTAAEFQ